MTQDKPIPVPGGGHIVTRPSDAPPLMTAHEAAAAGIERVRSPVWSDPLDHIKLNISDGKIGIWLDMNSPMNQSLWGYNPKKLLFTNFDLDARCIEPYTGPLPGSDEWLAVEAQFGPFRDVTREAPSDA